MLVYFISFPGVLWGIMIPIQQNLIELLSIHKTTIKLFFYHSHAFILMLCVGTERIHNEKIKEMRDEDVHKERTNKEVPRGEEGEKEGEKKKGAYVAVLTRNTDEVPQ